MKKKATISAAVLLLLGLLTWAYAYFRGDPEVDRIKKMMAETPWSKDQGKERFGQIRKEMEKLTPDQRKKVFEDMRKGFEARQREDMKKFFALSQKEKNALLDKRLKDMDKWRKEREARAKAGGGPNTKGQGANGSGGRGQNGQGNNQNGNNGGPGGPGGPRGRPGMSEDERDQRRKQRLDNGTPEDRAMRAEMRQQMNQRAKALGLPTGGGGRFGR